MAVIKKENLSQKKLEQYYNWCKIIQKGRANPVQFAEFFLGVEFMDYQRYVFMNSWDKQFVLWLFSRNGGKALALDTRIPTPNGDKTMADIKIGDYVFSEEGKPVRVTHISPIFLDKDCYDIVFDDGEIITASCDHLWEYKTNLNNFKYEVSNTKEMYSKQITTNFYIPIGKNPNGVGNGEDSFGHKAIVKIVKTKTVPTKCIMVEGDRHLYQCGEKNTVTHNSTLSAPFCMTKLMLFPNFRSYILSVTAGQSQ